MYDIVCSMYMKQTIRNQNNPRVDVILIMFVLFVCIIGYLPSSSFDDPSSSSFELPRNPPTASTLQPNGDLGHNLRGGSSNLYSRSEF